MIYIIKNIKTNEYYKHQYIYMSGPSFVDVPNPEFAKRYDSKEEAETEINNCLNNNYKVVGLLYKVINV